MAKRTKGRRLAISFLVAGQQLVLLRWVPEKRADHPPAVTSLTLAPYSTTSAVLQWTMRACQQVKCPHQRQENEDGIIHVYLQYD